MSKTSIFVALGTAFVLAACARPAPPPEPEPMPAPVIVEQPTGKMR